MGLRCLLFLLVVGTLLWESEATNLREKRQVSNAFPAQPSEPRVYQPPIALGAPSIPVASSATLQNSYQPPISLLRSNEYQSPLNPPQNYPANSPRSYQSPPIPIQGPQSSYVLPNQHQHQSHSVQYIPPSIPSGNVQQSFSVVRQPASNSVSQPATSYSVQQQPPQINHGQSFAILSDNSGLPHSTAERTYSTHSKVVGSHVPAQAIHKAPASEIQSDKGSAAKEKATNNDEYVVYYYYYYDNDTAANNLSLNFDDIPSLEAYDNDKLGKEPEKSASARTLAANTNSLTPAKPDKDGSSQTETSSSQPRSVGDIYGRPDRPSSHHLDDSLAQPLKPVSNVFRYGSNEVPRFPVLPNFIVTEVPTTVKPEPTPDTLITESPATQSAQTNAQPDLKTGDEADDDDLNNVLDSAADIKAIDDKVSEEELATTTTTTTTDPPTTTEEPTTTTEKPRRSRPSLGGGRRRFNPSPSSSFSSNRNRQPSGSRSSTSTTTTTTTTTSPPTRRSFQGSRIRPRPPIGSNRPRPGVRTSETSEDKSENKISESTTASTTTSRSRFTSASPRRFQSSRSRSQASSSTSSTTSTTRAPSSSISSRSRPSSRPRPNLISRSRPPRPGFPRPRPGSEPEEPETTTAPPTPTEEETSPETVDDELPSTNDESNETDEDNETSVEETEEPTTTEGNRFSALFRPRNRNSLGNRPRPVIGNRPSRS